MAENLSKRRGFTWCRAEDEDLVQEFHNFVLKTAIAHKRTVGGIYQRIAMLISEGKIEA